MHRSRTVHQQPLALSLLQFAARSQMGNPTNVDALIDALGMASEPEFRWNHAAGLGPLLFWALSGDLKKLHPKRAEEIHAAELTARIWHHERTEVMTEVIDACVDLGGSVTLLKGASMSTEYWPRPHARPMGDIDVLVEAGLHASFERELVRRGFVPMPGYQTHPGAKHGVPLRHPRSGVWVEVHNSLIDNSEDVGPLGRQHLSAHLLESDHGGRPVTRLSAEFQVLYTAHAWMSDISHYDVEIQPSGLPPVFDIAFLLAKCASRLDVTRFLDRTENAFATGATHVLLSFLDQTVPGLVPAAISHQARAVRGIVNDLQLRAMHHLLKRYLFGGRRWHRLYPLPVPGRYSLPHQLGKRLMAAKRRTKATR